MDFPLYHSQLDTWVKCTINDAVDVVEQCRNVRWHLLSVYAVCGLTCGGIALQAILLCIIRPRRCLMITGQYYRNCYL